MNSIPLIWDGSAGMARKLCDLVSPASYFDENKITLVTSDCDGDSIIKVGDIIVLAVVKG